METANEIHFSLQQRTVSTIRVEKTLAHDAVYAEMEASVRENFTDVQEAAWRACHVVRGLRMHGFPEFAVDRQVDPHPETFYDIGE